MFLHSNSAQAIFWAIISCFFAAIMMSIVKYLAVDVNPAVLVFWRNVIGLILFLPWMCRYKHRMAFKTSSAKLYILRGVVGFLAMLLWYHALTIVPLSHAVALNFTAPLFATLAAIVLLKEKIGLHRWGAMLLGLIGAVIILNPNMQSFEMVSFMVLFVSLLWGINAVIIKMLTRTESSRSIVFYMSAIMAPLSLPVALYFWQWPTLEQWLWIIALGLTSTISQLTLSKAMTKADLSVIIPYDFSRLVFASIMAYVYFSEVVELSTIVGSTIIVGSAFYIARREIQAADIYRKS